MKISVEDAGRGLPQDTAERSLTSSPRPLHQRRGSSAGQGSAWPTASILNMMGGELGGTSEEGAGFTLSGCLFRPRNGSFSA